MSIKKLYLRLNSPFNRRYWFWRNSLVIACLTIQSTNAHAQAVAQIGAIIPPQVSVSDPNNVDLLSGSAQFSLAGGSVGPMATGLSYTEQLVKTGISDNLSGYLVGKTLETSEFIVDVNIENKSNSFVWQTYMYNVNGSSYGNLDVSSDRKSFTYTSSDGSRYYFGYPSTVPIADQIPCHIPVEICKLVLLRTERPNGIIIECEWQWYSLSNGSFVYKDMRNIGCKNNLGYKIDFTYASAQVAALRLYSKKSSINYYNLAYYLTPIMSSTSVLDVSGGYDTPAIYNVDTTTLGGQAWNIKGYGFISSGVTSITRPGAAAVSPIYTYSQIDSILEISDPRFNKVLGVSAVTDNGRVTTYSYGGIHNHRVITSIQKPSNVTGRIYYYAWNNSDGSVAADAAYIAPPPFYSQHDLIAEVHDGLGNVTKYEWQPVGAGTPGTGSASLLKKITFPEGNSETFTYDSRMNVTAKTSIPKSGDISASLTQQVLYPAACLNPKTCNRPTAIIDPRNQRTDYTYDEGHGGILTETGPIDSNGVRPQKRYAYAQRYAWVLSQAGGYQRASTPVWVLASESTCRSSAATAAIGAPCMSNDEVRTEYDYGPDSGPNNLSVRGITVLADGQIVRTCYTYDSQGNRVSETQPRANLAVCP